ncbi:LPXTG cell wall anchor domain-containing protein [Kitasatospora sp. NBC_00070]|uniref:LAETG motif-containing sortase-dependent surface protein n=1 Tax=Kitasatospora sp. NBC_00070 TaxID=2975962 RepID=UPI0032491495
MARLRGIPGGLLAGAVGLGALTPLLLAGSAAAHTSEWTLSCDKVSIKVASYNPQFTNRITLTVDGEKLLDKKEFGASFSQDFPVKAHTADLPVVLTITTDEEPKNPVTKTGTVTPCPPPSPSPTPTPPKVTPTPAPSVSKPAPPKPTGPQLAETGGGSNAGLIAAAGGGVLVVGGALVFLSRRRSR